MLDATLSEELADGRLIILAELARQVNRMDAGDRSQISQARRLEVSVLQSFPYSPQPSRSVSRASFTYSSRAFRKNLQEDAFHRQRRDVVLSRKFAIEAIGQPGRGQSCYLTGARQNGRMFAQAIQRRRFDFHQ